MEAFHHDINVKGLDGTIRKKHRVIKVSIQRYAYFIVSRHFKENRGILLRKTLDTQQSNIIRSLVGVNPFVDNRPLKGMKLIEKTVGLLKKYLEEKIGMRISPETPAEIHVPIGVVTPHDLIIRRAEKEGIRITVIPAVKIPQPL